MHEALKRYLQKHNLSKASGPSNMGQWKEFLQGINDYYQNADHDRYLLEQALNISSEEMQERWERINKLLSANEKHISILKSQNKILSSISEESTFEDILQILAQEMAQQLDLDKTLVIQKDLSQEKFHIASAVGTGATTFVELSLSTKVAQKVLGYIDTHGTSQFFLSEEQTEVELFKKFFPNTEKVKRVWYIPILDNSAKYPSFLFLLPREDREPTKPESEVLDSLIQVIHIITYNFESKRRLEEEQVKVIAAGKKAALGEMAGGIAHEINNPLAIISGQTQKLKLLSKIGKIDSESLNDSADKILKTIDRLSRIVYALRAFSRDDSKIDKSASNIIQIIDDSLALCSEKIKNSGVELKTRYLAEELHSFCNSVQISQVIVNLISNAYDAINSQEAPWISIDVYAEKEEIIIKITDSGDGIPEEIQEKIMQPFFTTKEVGHGTGIGLSLSHGIIKEHGGVLEYNNSIENTQFIIRLPLCVSDAAEEKVAS